MAGNKMERDVACDLVVPGWLGRRPLIGAIMVLIGGLVFGVLAFNVKTHGPLLQWDVPLAREFHNDAANLSAHSIELILFGFYIGKELIQVLTILLILYFFHKRFWPELTMVLIGPGGGALLWYIVSHFFGRSRPEAQIGIVVSDPSSFPSGHVISSILFYGLLAYMLVPRMPSAFWKWFTVGAAVLALVYVAFSRLFLGGHYLTDILGGMALGIAWAGLAYTWIESIFKIKERSV
jgi:membrane-associated phospholipid phosphatase